ncbi:RNA polymerase sigma factor [Sphingomonas guangdongensis]|uniref:RNA polymerase sigma factor n=1 Tax=Sphingomonas guangdongensis TaxID=1141890 RepID=UPI001C54B923|nr:RNA polymerase sigma factor [Sphingomonas guangdongensis]
MSEAAEHLPEVCGSALTDALRRFMRQRVANHADGEDLVQETFVRLFSYKAPVNNAKALCFAIARNLLVDHARSARRVAVPLSDELVCPNPQVDVIVAYRRAVAIMATALERMPPLRREVFLRRRLDGLSTADIALGLDMSLAAVEKHVVRAFKDLRTALARRGFSIEHGA